MITRRAELQYRPDQTAESLLIEARIKGVDVTLETKFENGSAVSKGMQGDAPIATTDMASPQSVLLPNVFFGSHAVLARRLAGAAPGAEFRAFVGPGPGAQIAFRLRTEMTEQMQFGTSTFDVHHYELVFDNAGAPLADPSLRGQCRRSCEGRSAGAGSPGRSRRHRRIDFENAHHVEPGRRSGRDSRAGLQPGRDDDAPPEHGRTPASGDPDRRRRIG